MWHLISPLLWSATNTFPDSPPATTRSPASAIWPSTLKPLSALGLVFHLVFPDAGSSAYKFPQHKYTESLPTSGGQTVEFLSKSNSHIWPPVFWSKQNSVLIFSWNAPANAKSRAESPAIVCPISLGQSVCHTTSPDSAERAKTSEDVMRTSQVLKKTRSLWTSGAVSTCQLLRKLHLLCPVPASKASSSISSPLPMYTAVPDATGEVRRPPCAETAHFCSPLTMSSAYRWPSQLQKKTTLSWM